MVKWTRYNVRLYMYFLPCLIVICKLTGQSISKCLIIDCWSLRWLDSQWTNGQVHVWCTFAGASLVDQLFDRLVSLSVSWASCYWVSWLFSFSLSCLIVRFFQLVCQSVSVYLAHWLLVTDVSGKPVGPIFKGQAVKYCLTFRMGSTGCLETSVTTSQHCVTSQKSEDLSLFRSSVFTGTCRCLLALELACCKQLTVPVTGML
jgi:hypothetical protein